MANTANFSIVNGNNLWAYREMADEVISTLLNSCPLMAVLGLTSANKMDKMFGVGVPDSGVALSGAKIPASTIREADAFGFYSPVLESIFQYDVKIMGLRDTTATISVGSGATGTPVIAGGIITSITITAPGTGYSGAPPTVYAVDVGGGNGAVLRANIAGGVLSSIDVLSGGSGYSGSTAIIINSNNSAGTKNARPTFQWTRNQSIGLVYNDDIDRERRIAQGSKDIFNQGITGLVQKEQKNVAAGQIQRMEEDLLFKQPSDTSASAVYWDYQYGLKYALQNTNTYATVDRSLDANAYYRAPYDTDPHVFTLQSLYNDTLYNKQLLYKGGASNMGTIDAYLVYPSLAAKFNNESQAYLINANTDPNMQVLKRQYGFGQQVLKYNDVFIISDPRIPVGTVYGINSRSMLFMFRKGFKMNMGQLNDQTIVYGGLDARTFLCNTQYMFAVLAPALNVQYTNVT